MGFRLHHQAVTPVAEPQRWALLLHGIYGSGQNLRTLARRLTDARPDWGVFIVDLRQHGRSQGAPPPHTVASAATDVESLSAELTGSGKPVGAVIGHSFGGKVALVHRDHAEDPGLVTVLLDSSPRAFPGAIAEKERWAVAALEAMEELGPNFESREAFTGAIEARGFPKAVALWLATNLERQDDSGGYVLRLDLPSLRALLGDYYDRDLWASVEATERVGPLHVIAAGKSDVFAPSDLAALDDLERGGRAPVRVHRVADAGHWVHVDALDDVVAILAEHLPGTAAGREEE